MIFWAARTQESCLSCLQNAAESQFSELMSQSQMDAPAEGQDEGDIEKELRELNQQLLEEQQQLMTAQAECDRARRADSEAQAAWDTSRSVYCIHCVCFMHVQSLRSL